MKGLDLFCGLGGWSDGLNKAGFDMTGIEIEPDIAKMYKHKVIVTDVRKLDGRQFRGFDLIVGSPPCRDFTHFSYAICDKPNYNKRKWKKMPDPKEGLKNINAFLRIVKEAHPKYWLMENVPDLKKYIDMKPRMDRVRLASNMIRSFWGNFPLFLIPLDMTKKKYFEISKKNWSEIKSVFGYRRLLRSFIYARIPLPTGKALGEAIIFEKKTPKEKSNRRLEG